MMRPFLKSRSGTKAIGCTYILYFSRYIVALLRKKIGHERFVHGETVVVKGARTNEWFKICQRKWRTYFQVKVAGKVKIDL